MFIYFKTSFHCIEPQWWRHEKKLFTREKMSYRISVYLFQNFISLYRATMVTSWVKLFNPRKMSYGNSVYLFQNFISLYRATMVTSWIIFFYPRKNVLSDKDDKYSKFGLFPHCYTIGIHRLMEAVISLGCNWWKNMYQIDA